MLARLKEHREGRKMRDSERKIRAASVTLIVAGLLLLGANLARAAEAAEAAAADANPFHWQGKIAAGQVIEVKGVSGNINAQGVDGEQAEVTAVKSGRDSAEVKIAVVQTSEGVTICAIYRGAESDCVPGREWPSQNHDLQARVDFTVHVPRQVRFLGRTVNGGIEATDMGSHVDAITVNGSVRVSTAEWAEAKTVNGSVDAKIGKAEWPGELKFSSVNGAVNLELPASLNADAHFKTLNGNVHSEFPITIQGGFGGHVDGHGTNMTGRIGSGGRDLDIQTVNGRIELKKTGQL
jgi:cytoskeletal protein CcmA (bactofilin family)